MMPFQLHSNIIPDVIPDEKKPLEPPAEIYDDDDEYDEDD